MDRKVMIDVPSLSLTIYLPTHLSIYVSIYLSLSLCLSVRPSVCLSVCLSLYLSIYLASYLSISSVYLTMYLSICLSIYLPIYLSTCLSASLKTKLFCETSSFFKVDSIKNEAILRDFLNVWTWQRQKRSNSARLLHFLKLTTSKTKQFCETSSFFEVDNIKNERIPRDILQKWKVECRADGLVPMHFAILPVHLSKVLHLPRKSDAPVTQNHLSKPEDLRLQNVTPLTKSAPGPPDSSDEDVSCTAPATENSSLQILFKCPAPAIVFGNATKPSRFAHFWQGPQSLALATRNDIWTSKSGPNPWCF